MNVLVSQEKWDKTKSLLKEIQEELKSNKGGMMEHKPLERKRGFLIYVTRTYPSMVPFLKGIHLTLDGWRPDRDEEGWKVPPFREKGWGGFGCDNWNGDLDGDSDEDEDSLEKPPKDVKAVPRLRGDVEALLLLTEQEHPPLRRVRSKKVVNIYYGFGDASAVGYCSTLQKLTKEGKEFVEEEKIVYKYGHWCTTTSEESSNYRELLNLVDALENQVREGSLFGCEVFLFTDNSTAESVYYKGNSTSKKLFHLVVRLRRVEMVGDLILHVIHVSGKRMIAQGTDGGSRGDLNQGVMTGESMLGYVPLNLSATERQSSVVDWVKSIWEPRIGALEHLDPEGWFTTGHQGGNYLWTPAPAAADVVAEQVGEARHKRPSFLHLIVVPKLMTGLWRRMMLRLTDFNFTLPLGTSFWPVEEYEPLIIFACFPLIPYSPWCIRGTHIMILDHPSASAGPVTTETATNIRIE